MIRIKPITYKRLNSYIEEVVKKWFDKYYKVLKKYKIRLAKNVINFNKTGA
jgi:hypothetical protein